MICGLDIEEGIRRNGFGLIAGVDEVGRGALAGPVVAAAVILNFDDLPAGINDSKQLSKRRREQLAEEIKARAVAFAVARVEATEIDQINVLRASLQAMKAALKVLKPSCDYVLIDGNQRIPNLFCPYRTIVKGDCLSASIAAASIVAKVARDGIMSQYDEVYPGYTFHTHVGYGTRAHKEALLRLGPSPIHRMTFQGVQAEQLVLPIEEESVASVA
jgi:ribonuclease HII